MEDEADRGGYSLTASAIVRRFCGCTLLWFYEVDNGLTMACRRKRITYEQATEYLARVRRLPISADTDDPALILTLPDLARTYELTNYDAAHLELALRRNIALATTDEALRRAAKKSGRGAGKENMTASTLTAVDSSAVS